MKIVTEAAFFLSGRRDQCSQFRFQQDFLALSRAQDDDQRHSRFGQLSGLDDSASSAPRGCFAPFSLRHWAGIVLQPPPMASTTAAYFSAVLRPASRLSKFITVFSTSE